MMLRQPGEDTQSPSPGSESISDIFKDVLLDYLINGWLEVWVSIKVLVQLKMSITHRRCVTLFLSSSFIFTWRTPCDGQCVMDAVSEAFRRFWGFMTGWRGLILSGWRCGGWQVEEPLTQTQSVVLFPLWTVRLNSRPPGAFYCFSDWHSRGPEASSDKSWRILRVEFDKKLKRRNSSWSDPSLLTTQRQSHSRFNFSSVK